MSKNDMVKPGGSKQVTGKAAGSVSTHSSQKKSLADAVHSDSTIEQLNKALGIYIKTTHFDDLFPNRKKEISFTEFLSDKLLLVMVIRKGIPYSIFTLIKNITPFSLNDWANYLDISSKSLARYQQKDKQFKPSHTEKIIELAEVTNLGLEVFGENEKFRNWLETPNYTLGNLKPFDLLKDSYGKEMIIGELTRIEHGILA